MNKEEQYTLTLSQLKELFDYEKDSIANMANLSAVINTAFDLLWVGFYLVKEKELVLGPFQGEIACTRIQYGKGVCGTAWKERQSLIVPKVQEFEGHIVCDSLAKSEIVILIYLQNEIMGVLDIDSEFENNFSEIDLSYLEKIVKLFESTLK